MNRSSASTLAVSLRHLAALTVGFVLTFGPVAPHDPDSDHEGVAHGAFVDDAAQHPEAPPHFEGSHSTYRPVCDTCLLQLQAGSRLIAPLALLPELLCGEPVPVAASPALAAAFSLSSPARAPPEASYVL